MTTDQTLYAFYDLAVSPATYDFLTFLILTEHERQRLGCSAVHLVFVPGHEAGFRTGDLGTYRRIGARQYNTESLRWRLRNILLPGSWLLPACRQVTACATREEAYTIRKCLAKRIFPADYDLHTPRPFYGWRHFFDYTERSPFVASLAAPPQARAYVDQWQDRCTDGRKIITITLRECPYEPGRNSNLSAWGAFIKTLDQAVYYPVIIRDMDTAFAPLPADLQEVPVFPEAVWNLEIRAALYEAGYLNLYVNNGPAMVSLFNRTTRMLIFKIITESCGATSSAYFHSAGITPGAQYRILTPYQKLIWSDDQTKVLVREFKKLVSVIGFYENASLQQLTRFFSEFEAQGDLGKAEWISSLAVIHHAENAADMVRSMIAR